MQGGMKTISEKSSRLQDVEEDNPPPHPQKGSERIQ